MEGREVLDCGTSIGSIEDFDCLRGIKVIGVTRVNYHRVDAYQCCLMGLFIATAERSRCIIKALSRC